MREHRQIIERWRQGASSALITLVRVQGSSYRRTGAKLLVSNDGSYEGSVSAGCLEADLLRKAAWLTRNGASVERYSTLFDEDAEIPFGLGCGGVLDLLLEPAATVECQALMQAIESSLAGKESLVATWLPGSGRKLARAIFELDGERVFASSELSAEELCEARITSLRGIPSDGSTLFLERLSAPQRLFVFGAGNDAKPLVSMASLLGWSVIVTDGRSNLTRRERFPELVSRVNWTPEAAVKEITPRDAVVIMTHSFEQDRDTLASVLPQKPRYLGLLGSRQRSAFLITDVAARLNRSVSECCDDVNAPIGLDIGGEGAEAIALAIVAEVQACCSGKDSESRRLSADRIRQYVSDNSGQSYQSTQCSLGAI